MQQIFYSISNMGKDINGAFMLCYVESKLCTVTMMPDPIVFCKTFQPLVVLGCFFSSFGGGVWSVCLFRKGFSLFVCLFRVVLGEGIFVSFFVHCIIMTGCMICKSCRSSSGRLLQNPQIKMPCNGTPIPTRKTHTKKKKRGENNHNNKRKRQENNTYTHTHKILTTQQQNKQQNAFFYKKFYLLSVCEMSFVCSLPANRFASLSTGIIVDPRACYC